MTRFLTAVFTLLSPLGVGGCVPKDSPPASTSDAVGAGAVDALELSQAIALVSDLYSRYAHGDLLEPCVGRNNDAHTEQDPNVTIGRTVVRPAVSSAALEVLLERELAAERARNPEGVYDSMGMGALSCNVLLSCQQCLIFGTDYTVVAEGSHAIVDASVKNYDNRQTVRFDLIVEGGQWRINDVTELTDGYQGTPVSNVSLRAALEQP